jgi:hypothetical protein
MNINVTQKKPNVWNRPNKFFFVCESGVSPVESPADAAGKWEEFRDESNGGCSEIGNGGIVVNQHGDWVCKVSYNGRMWFSKDEIGPFDRYLLGKVALCAS